MNGNPSANQINNWTAQKAIRPEKVEEIKAVWDSPNFKTNNARLVHLFRHCQTPIHGYTIREFAHAIFPDKMTGPLSEEHYKYLAFFALRQMFRRFREDAINHEIVFFSKRVEVKGVARWYYYNMIDDEEAWKEVELRLARITLGTQKNLEHMEDILEMFEEERSRKAEEFSEEIRQKYTKRLERKKKKESKK